MKKLVVISLSAVIAFMFTACIDSEKVAEKATEKIIEKASGEKIDLETSKDGKEAKVVIKDKDGEEVTFSGGDDEIPEDFPKEIYVPEGIIESSGTISTGEGSMLTVNISSEESFKEIKEKINDKMKNAGWKAEQAMEVDESAMLNFTKGNNSATITLNKEGDKTSVSYMIGLSLE
jgi:hypothetical protein